MSRIQVDNIFDKEGTGAPSLPAGAVVTGVTTYTTFDGNLTGNVTGNITGDVTGNITGDVTGDVNAGTVTATTVQADTYVGVPEGTNVLKAMLFS